jgi:hypothetical protein
MLLSHPQTRPRALNTESKLPNPLKKVFEWLIEQYVARYERLNNARVWHSKGRVEFIQFLANLCA